MGTGTNLTPALAGPRVFPDRNRLADGHCPTARPTACTQADRSESAGVGAGADAVGRVGRDTGLAR